MKLSNSFIILLLFLGIVVSGVNIQAQVVSEFATNIMEHCEAEHHKAHRLTYVYKDANAPENMMSPHAEGDPDIQVSTSIGDPVDGRSFQKIIFPLQDSNYNYAAWRFTYPNDNFGEYPGLDLSGANLQEVFLRGKGNIELLIFGVNDSPFHNPQLPYYDKADIRSSGIIQLTEVWMSYYIDFTDTTIWVYKDPMAGAENRFPQILEMGNDKYFFVDYNADDGEGNRCIKAQFNYFRPWNMFFPMIPGCDFIRIFSTNCWSGFFLFPPEGDWSKTQGINLKDVSKVRFKAKLGKSKTGKAKFLFGRKEDSCRKEVVVSLNDEWKWITWNLKPDRPCSNITAGFGLVIAQDIGPGSHIPVFIDSVYYIGPSLSKDLTSVIGGLSVVAPKSMNTDTVYVDMDEASIDVSRIDALHYAPSFVTTTNKLDDSQQLSAHTYDNALLLIAYLAMYGRLKDNIWLNNAIGIGDAFLFSIENDRYFKDFRLRNVYSSGDLINVKDSSARLAGWWDEINAKWKEDEYFHGTSAGNMAWAGLSLLSLYQATRTYKYLQGAKYIAFWCLKNTRTEFGFTGGKQGWEQDQRDVKWKSTEHNIDLFAFFDRLYHLTGNPDYKQGAENAKGFVHAMWNETDNHFWTGTTEDGITPSKGTIPMDIQAWYVMAFLDTASTYTKCMQWVKNSCFLSNYESPNYSKKLSGVDFDTDLDGIWFEGTAQAALAYKMLRNNIFANLLLDNLRYVQTNGPNNNGKGIVAADKDHVSTGFDWEYHNRLHIGASSWAIFAELGVNPYYCPMTDCFTALPEGWENSSKEIFSFKPFPNPFSEILFIEFRIPTRSQVSIDIFDLTGKLIYSLLNTELEANFYQFQWDGRNENFRLIPEGTYLVCTKINDTPSCNKVIIDR